MAEIDEIAQRVPTAVVPRVPVATDADRHVRATKRAAEAAEEAPRGRLRVRVRPGSARKRILDEQSHVWFTREWTEIDPEQLRGRRGDLDLEVEEI